MNCSAEVKVKELGINQILGGHRELEVFEEKNSRLVVGLKGNGRNGSRFTRVSYTPLSYQEVIIFADDWADSDVGASLIGGFLGDDINAEIAAVDGGETEDFSKPLFGGLVVPSSDPERGVGQRVDRVGDKKDCVGVSKNRIGRPVVGVWPIRCGANKSKLAGGVKWIFGTESHDSLSKGLGHFCGNGVVGVSYCSCH